jgi:hypothetical protein
MNKQLHTGRDPPDEARGAIRGPPPAPPDKTLDWGTCRRHRGKGSPLH